MGDTKIMTLRLPAGDRDLLGQLAREDSRSQTAQIKHLIREAARARGIDVKSASGDREVIRAGA